MKIALAVVLVLASLFAFPAYAQTTAPPEPDPKPIVRIMTLGIKPKAAYAKKLTAAVIKEFTDNGAQIDDTETDASNESEPVIHFIALPVSDTDAQEVVSVVVTFHIKGRAFDAYLGALTAIFDTTKDDLIPTAANEIVETTVAATLDYLATETQTPAQPPVQEVKPDTQPKA